MNIEKSLDNQKNPDRLELLQILDKALLLCKEGNLHYEQALISDVIEIIEISPFPFQSCGSCERPATYSNGSETINRCDRCYDKGLGLETN